MSIQVGSRSGLSSWRPFEKEQTVTDPLRGSFHGVRCRNEGIWLFLFFFTLTDKDKGFPECMLNSERKEDDSIAAGAWRRGGLAGCPCEQQSMLWIVGPLDLGFFIGSIRWPLLESPYRLQVLRAYQKY